MPGVLSKMAGAMVATAVCMSARGNAVDVRPGRNLLKSKQSSDSAEPGRRKGKGVPQELEQLSQKVQELQELQQQLQQQLADAVKDISVKNDEQLQRRFADAEATLLREQDEQLQNQTEALLEAICSNSCAGPNEPDPKCPGEIVQRVINMINEPTYDFGERKFKFSKSGDFDVGSKHRACWKEDKSGDYFTFAATCGSTGQWGTKGKVELCQKKDSCRAECERIYSDAQE